MRKRMFKFASGFAGIISIFIFAACGANTDRAAMEDDKTDFLAAPTREYSEKELQFIEEYDSFLQTYNPSEEAAKIVTANPENSDFAIISLEKEVYGTGAFAFLPIDARKLTKEELLQLAAAFDGAEGEFILRDYCSYKYTISEKLGIDSNRGMTSGEEFEARIKLAGEYFGEGRRPEKGLGESGQDEVLLYTACTGKRVWLYPAREMTETEILQILDVQYGTVDPAFYTPKEGQLSLQDAGSRAKDLLKIYLPKKQEAEDIYLLYYGENTQLQEDYWQAFVHLKKSNYDISLTFTADTGEFIELKKKGKDYYTKQHFLEAVTDEKDEAVVRKDEELKEAAKKYMNELSSLEAEEKLEPKVLRNEDSDDTGTVSVRTKDGDVYKLQVNKKDLSIVSVIKK